MIETRQFCRHFLFLCLDDVANIKNNDAESIHEQDDAADREVAGTTDFNAWLQNMASTINASSKQPISLTPQSTNISSRKASARSSPLERQRTPSPKTPIPDEELYKPPFGPKKTSSTVDNEPSVPTPMATNNETNNDLDDFFS